MNHRDDAVRLFLEFLRHVVDDDRRSPGELQGVDLGPEAACHLAHPDAEDPVDQDEHRVARLDEVDEAGLHARRARAGDRDGQVVPRVQERPQVLLEPVHDLQEIGVEMAQRLGADGLVDLRGHAGGPRPHQQHFLDPVEQILHRSILLSACRTASLRQVRRSMAYLAQIFKLRPVAGRRPRRHPRKKARRTTDPHEIRQ